MKISGSIPRLIGPRIFGPEIATAPVLEHRRVRNHSSPEVRKVSYRMIIQAPGRAIEHLKEARMYVNRMILPASGELRTRATRVADTISALIKEIETLEKSRK